jgi:hypothetical protein
MNGARRFPLAEAAFVVLKWYSATGGGGDGW